MNDTNFSTQDMSEAAFIWCQPGADFVGLKLKSGDQRKETFLFQFTLPLTADELVQLILKYQNGKTLVEPFAFVKYQNQLRDSIKRAARR